LRRTVSKRLPKYGAGTSAATRFIKVRTQIDESNWKEGYSWYDGLGRTIKSQSVDAAAGDVFTETEYDIMGRAKRSTNPYKANETKLWTTPTYDDLGRVTKVQTPDNAEVNTSYSLGTGTTVGAVVTVTDQAGKTRRSITNGLGQLARVDEPNDANGLGTIESPNQATSYGYDTLSNLTTVNQGVQTRSFVYDSLSRLKSATNPESGLINYSYDANGNLTQKTDARSIQTNFTYDALNRVTARSYSDSTPAVSYFYDNLQNAKGKLIKVSSAVSTTEYTGFDNMGRVLSHKQTTDGTAYTTEYKYNLSGALVEETYPSTRVVKNVLDNGGDLELVQSKKNQSAGFWNYAKSFSYTAAGAVSSMQLDNGKWESTVFNSRLQPTRIALGTVQNGTDKLKLNYDYGTQNNNGNVLSQTITTPTTGNAAGFTATQNYVYDSLNRLKSATETINSATSWKQSFTYDRYGNRNFDTANTTTLGSCPAAQCNPTVDISNNRFTTGQGYTFDLAGNIITDAQGRTFNYDGENKQKSVSNAGGSLGTYFYDGDGKRVKKVVGAETTIFVYDAQGKLVAEYSNQISPTPQVSYLTQDNLGTPRINTDANGNVIARHDYLPFGEEIDSTITAIRNVNLNYGDDGIKNKFTGYTKDTETDLDFAQARYYKSAHGRFTSADEPFADQNESDPQTWNLYTYSRNNPIRFTDPSGKNIWDRIKNYYFYGYAVENDRLAELEQERRDWLTQNILQKDKDGNWHQVDVSNFTTLQVFDTYNELKSQYENGDLEHVPDSLAREALNLLPIPLPATTTTTTVGNDLKNIRDIESGRLKGYSRGNTKLSGGAKAAQKTFEQLTGRKPIGNFDRVVQGTKEIVYRASSKSDLPKVEIIDHAQKFLEKISFIK
jgi:RHS repeat-associated protein